MPQIGLEDLQLIYLFCLCCNSFGLGCNTHIAKQMFVGVKHFVFHNQERMPVFALPCFSMLPVIV